jgi:membrane protease YdiL (CAAX protease family)
MFNQKMESKMDKKKILLFLGLAFGISWIFGLIVFLTGQITNSPELIPNSGITLALILTASGYMWGPALAHILTRLITRSDWKNIYLKPEIRSSWKYLLAGWFVPGLLTILGSAIFFFILPAYYDPALTFITAQLEGTGSTLTPLAVILMQTVIALFISAPINALATFGEEFGWRGFLLPALLPLGKRKALLLSSAIWGVWHWPLIWMGHNYGLDYWGYPWLGLAGTIWFTVSIGIFIGWLSLKGRSVWPAVFAHGALNGLAAIGMLFLKGTPPMLLGPTPAGILGVLPFTLVSVWIFLKLED